MEMSRKVSRIVMRMSRKRKAIDRARQVEGMALQDYKSLGIQLLRELSAKLDEEDRVWGLRTLRQCQAETAEKHAQMIMVMAQSLNPSTFLQAVSKVKMGTSSHNVFVVQMFLHDQGVPDFCGEDATTLFVLFYYGRPANELD